MVLHSGQSPVLLVAPQGTGTVCHLREVRYILSIFNVLGDCFIILSDCVYMTAQICTHIAEHDMINSAGKIAAYFKNKK